MLVVAILIFGLVSIVGVAPQSWESHLHWKERYSRVILVVLALLVLVMLVLYKHR